MNDELRESLASARDNLSRRKEELGRLEGNFDPKPWDLACAESSVHHAQRGGVDKVIADIAHVAETEDRMRRRW
jgi:hypothetical protein